MEVWGSGRQVNQIKQRAPAALCICCCCSGASLLAVSGDAVVGKRQEGESDRAMHTSSCMHMPLQQRAAVRLGLL